MRNHKYDGRELLQSISHYVKQIDQLLHQLVVVSRVYESVPDLNSPIEVVKRGRCP
jgi:hypothetical protein